tara:strand:- start:2699 stop:2989 length:291 start_codon:yes stop_codon:yes gene_type:complete
MFSGVVYLKTAKEKADISFENFATKRFHIEAHEYNIYNCAEITYTQSEKDILIFPSETHHKICRNEGRGERISLAFNFIPIGRIGIEGEDSFCEIY